MTSLASFVERVRSPKGSRWLLGGGIAFLLVLLIAPLFISDEPDPVGGPPMVRRLTEAQYRNIIADVFAPDIAIIGRFEPPFRAHGLIAVGTGVSGISPFAVEQYDASALGIADSVMAADRRDEFLGCGPEQDTQFDDDCAREFFARTGRRLFRRPLSESEVEHFTQVSRDAAAQLDDNFYDGVELGLYSMLIAPDFLFRIERTVPAADGAGVELDPFSKAERLSFFLVNSAPDDELLDAAAAGELDSGRGIRRQADRLMESERFAEALSTFFADMLEFDSFDAVTKDPAIYPAFDSTVAQDAQEQTLRTIVHHLLEEDGDYRDLFTTRDTFLTRSLGVVYQTPVPAREGWTPVSFAPDAGRAGIQSHVSFLALHSHPGRSSPTLRGYALRQVFLCQEVPDPPANVNFTAIEEHVNSANVTARDRLQIHSTEPSCAGCHKVMDPLGLAMEGFDGVGTFRTHENGEVIDLSGELDGTAFSTTDGLAEALRNHPETPRCLAQRMYTGAVGRDIEWGERYYLDWLIDNFADSDYNVPALMRRIATSRNFFAVTAPTGGSANDIAQGEPPRRTGDRS